MAKRRSEAERQAALVKLLCDEGAAPAVAEEIVAALLDADLSVTQAQTWLANRDRGHPIRTGRKLGPDAYWDQVPTHAIGQGYADLVLKEARRFARASEDECLISWLLACHMADLERLTGGDPGRAATIAAILRLLRRELGTDTRVQDIVVTRWGPIDRPPKPLRPRLIDEILSGDEERLLARLEAREIDLEGLLRDGYLELGW